MMYRKLSYQPVYHINTVYFLPWLFLIRLKEAFAFFFYIEQGRNQKENMTEEMFMKKYN